MPSLFRDCMHCTARMGKNKRVVKLAGDCLSSERDLGRLLPRRQHLLQAGSYARVRRDHQENTGRNRTCGVRRMVRFEQDLGPRPEGHSRALDRRCGGLRLTGVLTAAERHLVRSLSAEKGRDLLDKSDATDRNSTAPDGCDDRRSDGRQSADAAPRYQHGYQKGAAKCHGSASGPHSSVVRNVPEGPCRWM